MLAQKRPGGVHDGYQVHLVHYREQLGGAGLEERESSQALPPERKTPGQAGGSSQRMGMTWASVPVLHTPSTHGETRSGERC